MEIDSGIAFEAQRIARSIAASLNLVGLLTVEFFLTHDDILLFNKMAPGPHHCGLWTLDGCSVSQFEQFVRAICGLPLMEPRLHTPIQTKNLSGKEPWIPYLNDSNAKLHLYGTNTETPGQNIGHVNILMPSKSSVT